MTTLVQRLDAYEKLVRLDRPIGILLLLWPTLWALWIAWRGLPNLIVLWLFVLGTVIMRSAGCAINDYADRNFDAHVERTRNRFVVGRLRTVERNRQMQSLATRRLHDAHQPELFERVPVERVVRGGAGLARDRVGEAAVERALREDGADVLAADQPDEPGRRAGGRLRLRRLRRDHRADDVEPVAVREVAEGVVVGDELPLRARQAREARAETRVEGAEAAKV